MEALQILQAVFGVLAGLIAFAALLLWDKHDRRKAELAKKRQKLQATLHFNQLDLEARRLKIQTINQIRTATNSDGS